ncbi:MAG: response regulator [bacterium]|nr:response regulator [bacterium]
MMERKLLVSRVVLFICGFLYLGLFISGTDGYKFIKNYNRQEHGQHPQNWCVVRDKRGVVYIGNNGCVLEYDGVSWRIIDVKPGDSVRSMAIHKDTIYVGGDGTFGKLEPQPDGTLTYQSLSEALDKEIKFSYVLSTHAVKGGIYFRSENYLFYWDSKTIKALKPSVAFKASFFCNGALYLQDGDKGIFRLEKGELKHVPALDSLPADNVRMMVPYEGDTVLLATWENGCFLYDGRQVVPFHTATDEYLKENKIYHGIHLSDGTLALGTRYGGLVILDASGNLKNIYNKAGGLQDDYVQHVYQDSAGHIWMGMDNGISRIEYHSPFSFIDTGEQLPGVIVSIRRHLGRVYVGTTKGLFYVERKEKGIVHRVEGMSIYTWSLLPDGENLLVATSASTGAGVYVVDKNHNIKRITKERTYVLLRSRKNPNRIWVGGRDYIVSLVKSPDGSRWMEQKKIQGITRNVRTLHEDENGNLWACPSPKGAVQIESPTSGTPVLSVYGTEEGLPEGEIRVFKAAGHFVFATGSGLYRFQKDGNRFVPDNTLGKEFAGGGEPVFQLAEDRNKTIWFHSKSRNYRALPQTDGTYRIDDLPLLRLPSVQVNTIYPSEATGDVLFGTAENLIFFKQDYKKNYLRDYRTLIRKVLVEETLFPFYNLGGNEFVKTWEFSHQQSKLYFEFAAPFLEGEESVRYKIKLEDVDEEWLDYIARKGVEYKTLRPGYYNFNVKAVNVYKHEGGAASFKFRILEPWYNTWWAYLLYITASLGLTYLVSKWRRSIHLEKEKRVLEKTVAQRTTEINEKNHQLESQTLQLIEQSQKLKEMDKIKSNFFANISHEFRTPLTLIMGPMEQIMDETPNETHKKKMELMLRNSQRLLTLINQLLDLSRFDSDRIKLQAASHDIVAFLKGIVSSFQLLASQWKITLDFVSPEETVSLYYEPLKLEEVFCNLLLNAFKFTPAGGTVTVAARLPAGDEIRDKKNADAANSHNPRYLEISVADTGVGIPREQLVHIFDRFYQAKGDNGSDTKGTGIGLALTKELVSLHHGKIDAHSVEGEGTEFIIRLPLGSAHLESGELAPINAETVSAETPGEMTKRLGSGEPGDLRPKRLPGDETAAETTKETPGTGEGEAHEEFDGEQQVQHRNVILVVEDNEEMRAYIREPLEAEYTVREAVNGKEGIRLAREIIPDLIISDIMMPEADGYQLARELKKDVRTSHIPIILLTAKASEGSMVEGLETGADDYITKPFNTRILNVRIRNLIELRAGLQQKIQRQMLLQPEEIAVSSVDREFIKELQGAIRKNISDVDFGVDQLGKVLIMSRATLYRKVTAVTGQSPREFIKSYRLKRGAQLLKGNSGNVTEVAFEVGFSSSSYFIKCFKEQFHQSPHAYQVSQGK